ncbi:hypothetical protein H5410_052694 [Solanum commersonii]|uniref:Uncharacterized protein n=1 Tax=Solanum commersonii TaxID=4109 RepID=A0A9J5X1T1_SOLCO|nr:hypothetical protein H5410_052694 [Solanum commersonii]
MPIVGVVDVSIEDSENECMREEPPLVDIIKKKAKHVKKTNKRKSRASQTSALRPGPKRNQDDYAVSKQTIINNLRLQRVLGGRVFDPDIITKPGMTKSFVLHEEKVRELYYNIEFAENGSINSNVGGKSLYLDEDLLGQILEVPREGIRSLVEKTFTTEFVKECSKILNTRRAGVQKNLMKREYQLLFEFVNKVLLPRTKKRTAASTTDLYIMEALCKFEPIDLPALIMEHLYKSMIKHKGKNGIGYDYFLTKVFHHLNILVGTGKIGTAQCIEGKAGPLSKISQLVMEQGQLKHELEEITVRVSNKDAGIALLKAELLKAQTEGPGTKEVKELKKQNEELLAKIVALQEKMILSKIPQLVMEQDQLKHELKEMTVRVSNKDAEIALLKAELLKAQTEGHGTEEVKEPKK